MILNCNTACRIYKNITCSSITTNNDYISYILDERLSVIYRKLWVSLINNQKFADELVNKIHTDASIIWKTT